MKMFCNWAVVMAVPHCKYTKNSQTPLSKWEDFTICELHLNKVALDTRVSHTLGKITEEAKNAISFFLYVRSEIASFGCILDDKVYILIFETCWCFWCLLSK